MSEKQENKQYKILNKEEKNKEVELEIEVTSDFVETFRSKAIKELGKEIEIKGFRKGTAPEKMIVQHIGEQKVYEEMVYSSINSLLPVIVIEQEIIPLTQPKITITKIALGNPLVFKVSFILMPEVELPDYKKIAKSVKASDKVEVTDEEVNSYIEYIRKSRAESEALKNKTSGEPKHECKDENCDHKHENELPEFNDEFVKTLGNFKNVDDFKKQLLENMQADKERHTKEKRRVEIIEKIIEESKVELPDILIEEELDRMMEQFKGDIRNMRMSPEEYLKEIKKTENDLRTEWKPDAVKRAKMNLILPKIAMTEKIEADQEKVKSEAKHLADHHKVDIAQAEQYVNYVLRNEAVLKFLEEQK